MQTLKRTMAVLLAMLLLCFPFAGADEGIIIYSNDGRSAVIDGKQLDDYKKVGWYENFEDTVAVLYSLNGSSIRVFKAEVPAYLAVGWYENYEDTVETLYTLDGRSALFYKADVPAYLALGWYENFDDTVSMLYSPSGGEIRVYKAEVPAYVALGWFENREDTIATVFNDNGDFIDIYKGQVADYVAVGWYLLPTKIDPSKPMIALTFDDGPNMKYTPRILNTFEKYRAKATFFIVGMMVSSNPESVRRELAMGCEIGSHTYNHPNLATLSADQVSNELSSAAGAIQSACGAYPSVFRPSYGTYNATVSTRSNLPLISWSVDPEDWRTRNAMSTFNHIISHVQDGDIVLMHDVYDATAQAVEMLVPALLKRGYQLVTVSELAMYKTGSAMQVGKMYYKFR